MKIVVASPLYPPDIAEPAPYVKELAKRLSSKHRVTVVTYGHLPEQVEGVDLVAVDKRQSLLVRLGRYYFALRRAAYGADLLYMENGPSVELPAGAFSRLNGIPLVMHVGDSAAHANAQRSFFLSRIERFALDLSRQSVRESPPSRPEILPFEPKPEAALREWESAWKEHIEKLEDLFSHAR